MMDADEAVFPHEKLEVWQRAVDFSVSVYAATAALPSEEKFGLQSQMRRASVSVSSNIAEGNGRATVRDKVRFVEIAYGSLMEVVSQAEIATRLGFLTADARSGLRSEALIIARQLSNLRTSLERRAS